MTNPMDMQGRHILVTGASSGIGREAAILLSALGASLTITGRDAERLEHTRMLLKGTGHQAEPFDLSALDQIPRWIKALTAAKSALTGAVHCAGIHNTIPIRVLSPAALDSMMRVNVHSAAMLARGFVQKGCHTPDGCSMVFLSSVAGMVGEGGVSTYSASKAALIGLTRSLAVELAPEAIRVNAIAPGFVETEMSDRLKESLTPEQFSAIEKKHLIGIGKVRDIANGIAFLLSDCSRWITGTTLVIDGGYTAQ
jgi:NAD(P)-dependent dehydrogenase (short-subunit alcohol dehydrogenase family)